MKLIEGLLWRLGYVGKSEAQHNQEREVRLRKQAQDWADKLQGINADLQDELKRKGADLQVALETIEQFNQERADVLIKTHNNALRKAKPKATRKRAA